MAKRLMIVDDSRVVYEEMMDYLQGSGIEVVAYCRDGESAVETYKEVKPDAVTMDIVLPGMDGLEAAEKILKDSPEAKVIIVSSLAYDETIEQGKRIGATSFVYKPIQKPELIGALLEALASK